MPRHERWVGPLLLALVVFDAVLVVWAFALPDLWYFAFHTTKPSDGFANLFLSRCGANWGAFLILQFVAWRRWRVERWWLAVIAGVRLSDVFTDLVYSLRSPDPTWFSYASLPLMSVMNLGIGVFLLRVYRDPRDAP